MALLLLLLLKLLELLLGQGLLDDLLAVVAPLAIGWTDLALEVEGNALLTVLGTALDYLLWTTHWFLLLQSLKLRQSRFLIRRLFPDQFLLGNYMSQELNVRLILILW